MSQKYYLIVGTMLLGAAAGFVFFPMETGESLAKSTSGMVTEVDSTQAKTRTVPIVYEKNTLPSRPAASPTTKKAAAASPSVYRFSALRIHKAGKRPHLMRKKTVPAGKSSSIKGAGGWKRFVAARKMRREVFFKSHKDVPGKMKRADWWNERQEKWARTRMADEKKRKLFPSKKY